MVLVDDTAVGRSAVTRLLSSHPGVLVAGQAENGQDALALADRLQPDLLITDLQMPGLDGFQLVERLHKKYPKMRLIIISAHDGPTCHALSLLHGADAFITKQQLPHELPLWLIQMFPSGVAPATARAAIGHSR